MDLDTLVEIIRKVAVSGPNTHAKGYKDYLRAEILKHIRDESEEGKNKETI